MRHFLLESHRPSGELRTLRDFDTDGHAAMQERFALEGAQKRDTEVVSAKHRRENLWH